MILGLVCAKIAERRGETETKIRVLIGSHSPCPASLPCNIAAVNASCKEQIS